MPTVQGSRCRPNKKRRRPRWVHSDDGSDGVGEIHAVKVGIRDRRLKVCRRHYTNKRIIAYGRRWQWSLYSFPLSLAPCNLCACVWVCVNECECVCVWVCKLMDYTNIVRVCGVITTHRPKSEVAGSLSWLLPGSATDRFNWYTVSGGYGKGDHACEKPLSD